MKDFSMDTVEHGDSNLKHDLLTDRYTDRGMKSHSIKVHIAKLNWLEYIVKCK